MLLIWITPGVRTTEIEIPLLLADLNGTETYTIFKFRTDDTLIDTFAKVQASCRTVGVLHGHCESLWAHMYQLLNTNLHERSEVVPADVKDIDTCTKIVNSIPYDEKDGTSWRMKKSSWNGGLRLVNVTAFSSDDPMLYIGGFEGADLRFFLTSLSTKEYHVFEPIKKYAQFLETNFAHYQNVNVYNFGLGMSDRESCFLQDGDSSKFVHDTFVAVDGTKQVECSRMRNISSMIIEELRFSDRSFSVHMNCEGCEFEVLQSLIHTGLINRVRMLQFGSHRVQFVENPVNWYCSIRILLLETHDILWGQPWAWERWLRKW